MIPAQFGCTLVPQKYSSGKESQSIIISMSISTSVAQNRAKVKVVMLGDQGVGKTSIIQKFVHNKFDEIGYPTVGIDFLAKDYVYKNQKVRLQLWDTAGQQRFRSLIPSYLKDSNCCIIVFDLTNKQSYENIEMWLSMYRENKGNCPIAILAGNKSDASGRVSQFQEVDGKAKQLGVKYVEISAKTGNNLQRLFQTCLDQVGISANRLQTGADNAAQQRVQASNSVSTPKANPGILAFPLRNGVTTVEKGESRCKC